MGELENLYGNTLVNSQFSKEVVLYITISWEKDNVRTVRLSVLVH